MRKSRRIQLAGLVALAGTGAAGSAAAADLSIANAQTNPVLTSSAGAAPGTVTVTTAGSVTVDGANEAAITVDSNHNVTNLGTLASTGTASGTGGILIEDGHSGTITNTGQINIIDGYSLADGDSDGDPDGEFATGSGRYGILLESGSYTGNIISNGSISVEGVGSYGIRLNGLLDGDGTTTGNLTIGSSTSVLGDDSVGIAIEGGPTGGVVGDVNIAGTVLAVGERAVGMLVDAEITGGVTISGAWRVTGYQNTQLVTSTDPGDDNLIGGPAILIQNSIGAGIKLHGIGVEEDDDDDGDGTNDEADDDRTAEITSYGSEAALNVTADGVNVLLGPTGDSGGFGIYNLGTLSGLGVQTGVDAVAMRLEGIGGSTVNTSGGIYNEGTIFSSSREGSSTGLSIGADTTVLLIHNLGSIQAVSISQGVEQLVAIDIEIGADSVPEIRNDGVINASVAGESSNVVAIRDASGTLTTITNTGSILTSIVPSDADTITGTTVAIDVQNANSFVTITQNNGGDADATNQRITGDILLSDYGDIITLDSGRITGDISFGLGADTFDIDGGSTFTGEIDDIDEDLAIGVLDGTLHLTGGNAVISSATFGADSTLIVDLSGNPLDDALIEADTVTFVSGARVIPVIPLGLEETSQIFLTAGAMTGGLLVAEDHIEGEGIPYIYDLSIELTNPGNGDGLANGLRATYEIKDADTLGLTQNQGAALDAIIHALQQDDDASAAFLALDDQATFFDAYQDLMPSYASASAEIAMTAIQQMQSATSNRLAATRLHGLDEVSAWAQEIGYGLDREPPTPNGQRFRGHGFGMATGIDGPLDNGALFGLSASFLASEVEEPTRPDGEISASVGQLNAYLGTAMGPFDVDVIVGAGAGKMQSRRFVAIADTFNSISEADWWAYEGHGAVRVSAPMSLSDWLVVTPQAALTYVYLNEEGYTEEGGGSAIDYEVDSAASQRLWGDVGVEFSTRFRFGARSVIAPRVFAGYRANLIDDDAERTFRFVSTGDEFSLTDEALGDGGPLVGIGVDATNGYSTIALGYEGEFGDQIERHSLNVSVRFRF